MNMLVSRQTRPMAEILPTVRADEHFITGVNPHVPGKRVCSLKVRSTQRAVEFFFMCVCTLHVSE
uniref:Uncharacterized protein n=1 Tax=Anguilla anguilla TaxID=7936 RepID=A0A0E9R040_ANGAN